MVGESCSWSWRAYCSLPPAPLLPWYRWSLPVPTGCSFAVSDVAFAWIAWMAVASWPCCLAVSSLKRQTASARTFLAWWMLLMVCVKWKACFAAFSAVILVLSTFQLGFGWPSPPASFFPFCLSCLPMLVSLVLDFPLTPVLGLTCSLVGSLA